MSAPRDPDVVLAAWLDDGPADLPVLDAPRDLDRRPDDAPGAGGPRPACVEATDVPILHASPERPRSSRSRIGALRRSSFPGTPGRSWRAPVPDTSACRHPGPVSHAVVRRLRPEFPASRDDVAPGTYVWRGELPRPRLDRHLHAPRGLDEPRLASPTRTAGGSGEIAFGNWIIANARRHPCHGRDRCNAQPSAPTVDELAAALATQTGPQRRPCLRMSRWVDRQAGRVVNPRGPRHGLDLRRGVTDTWVAPGEDTASSNDALESRHAPRSAERCVYIADVDGDRLVIDTWHMPGTRRRGSGGTLDAILASMRHLSPTARRSSGHRRSTVR